MIRVLYAPTMSALVPDIVTKNLLVTANALMGITHRAAVTIGSAVAGILIIVAGPQLVFWVDAFTFLCLAVIAMFIRTNVQKRQFPSRQPLSSPIPALRESLRLAFSDRTILFTVFVFSIASVSGASFSTLALPFAIAELGSDENGFGLLLSARALGVLVGTTVILLFGANYDRFRTALFGLVGAGIVFISLGVVHSLQLAVGLMLVEGVISSGFVVYGRSLQQECIPADHRGRITALSMGLSQGVYMLWSAAAAGIAVWTSIPVVFSLSGIVLLTFTAMYFIVGRSA